MPSEIKKQGRELMDSLEEDVKKQIELNTRLLRILEQTKYFYDCREGKD